MLNKLKITIVFFLLSLTLISCSSVEVIPMRGPSGKMQSLITCESKIDCYQEANEVCPYGYKLKEKDQKTEIIMTTMGPIGGTSFMMRIECRG